MALTLLGPPLSALSPQGAFWGLLFGLAVGLLRMILEFSYPAPACGEADRRPAVLKDLHYLYFALLLCGLTAIVIVAVSLCTTPIPEEKASGALGLGPLEMLSLPPGAGILPLSFMPLGCLLCGHTHVLGMGSSLDYSVPDGKLENDSVSTYYVPGAVQGYKDERSLPATAGDGQQCRQLVYHEKVREDQAQREGPSTGRSPLGGCRGFPDKVTLSWP